MKRISIIGFAMLVAISAWAQGTNHGITLTWNASPSAAGCTGTCTGSYLVFEGPASGQESTTPLATVTATTDTDNGPTMNAYLGTTRCYVVAFQEVIGGLTLTSANSNEACFSFPQTPGSASTLEITAH